MDINQHVIQGRLTDDPQIINTASGEVARLRVATNRFYIDRHSGERKQRSAYHTVLVPGFLVDEIASARKGSKVFASGYAEDYEYVDGQGARRSQRQLIAEAVGVIASAAPAHQDRRGSLPASRRADPPAPPRQSFDQRRRPPRAPAEHLNDPAGESPHGYRTASQPLRQRSTAPVYQPAHSGVDYGAGHGIPDEFADLDRHVDAFGGSHG